MSHDCTTTTTAGSLEGTPSAVASSALEPAQEVPGPSASDRTQDEVYFWKADEPHGFLAQWYPSRFTDPTTATEYANAEQYMMHRKAVLFGDQQVAAEILATEDPRTIMALGRRIARYDEATWTENRSAIVRDGNLLKFGQNEELRKLLLETGDSVLVETSPMDRIWGVGFGHRVAASQRDRWGLNLLGKALMEVREQLRLAGNVSS
ncbi:hypothetical protein HK405_013667 [Cladochytrium tenue]|nr:hypothetical protein HK405_013667 [Cladochytrium tenue]